MPPFEIGEIAVYARRKGGTWFLAVMNGVGDRKIKIPLSFLKGKYAAQLAKDDPSKTGSMIIEHATFTSTNTISFALISGGGYIARFTK